MRRHCFIFQYFNVYSVLYSIVSSRCSCNLSQNNLLPNLATYLTQNKKTKVNKNHFLHIILKKGRRTKNCLGKQRTLEDQVLRVLTQNSGKVDQIIGGLIKCGCLH